MTRLALASLAAALVAALAVAPAGASRATCSRPHSKTLAQNGVARVFERRGGPDANYDKRMYGCLRSNGRAIALEDAFDDHYVTHYGYFRVRLAGRFAAWGYESYDVSCKADCPPGYDPTTDDVAVRDLRRHRTRYVRAVARAALATASSPAAARWRGSSRRPATSSCAPSTLLARARSTRALSTRPRSGSAAARSAGPTPASASRRSSARTSSRRAAPGAAIG